MWESDNFFWYELICIRITAAMKMKKTQTDNPNTQFSWENDEEK